MKIFHLNANKFSGLLPSTFSNDCRLVSINLGTNKLEGRLPRSLNNCQYLKGLDIGNNRIQDEFPFWMEGLPELRVLVLRSNKFGGNMSRPSSNKILFPMLQVLDVSNNELVGSLPQTYFKNFKAMTEAIGIDYDSFLANLEMKLTLKGQDQLLNRLLETFTSIDLSSNRFSGIIPTSTEKLKILKYLNLSHKDIYLHLLVT
ncbi:receptor like protein 26-like [Salvia hispanica]|uniref:receptor like protein 26-like n=1 Tax=Salvia hispanica TaxID=49212 RepID=UPI002008FCA7|nr:receptor like protein 26-like [Salvia hispanica]